MALLNNLKGACEAQLRYMSEFQGVNYAFNLTPVNGMLQFLASDLNIQAAGAQVLELGDQNGKIKRARIIYSQRGKYTDAKIGSAALAANVCDTPVTKAEKDKIVEITNRVATEVLTFTNTQLNELCENPRAFMEKYLLSSIASARELLDRQLLANVDAAKGKILHADGTTTASGGTKSLKLISINATSSERTPVFSNYNQIKLDLQKMQLRGVPAIIGEGNINEFYDLMGFACCNSTTPYVDAINKSRAAFFLDQNANSVLGSNDFLVVAPGAFMLLTYNKNRSILMNNDIERHFLLPDPEVPGLMWDVDMKWNTCLESWTWFASVHFETFGTFQDDSFQSGDILDDTKGVFGYNALAS
jgi:hypothetical protein